MSDKTKFSVVLLISIVMLVFAVSCGNKQADVVETTKPAAVSSSAVKTADSVKTAEAQTASVGAGSEAVVSEDKKAEEKGSADVVEFLIAEPKKGDVSVAKSETEADEKSDSKSKAKSESEFEFVLGGEKSCCPWLSWFDRSKLSLSLYVNPYVYQNYVFPDYKELGIPETLHSKYGFGGGLRAEYDIKNGLYVAADLGTQILFLEGGSTLVNIPFMGMVGYRYNFKNCFDGKLSVFGETGFGMKLAIFDGRCDALWLTGVEIGADYRFNNHFSATLGCKGLWNWQKQEDDGLSASTWGLNAILGLKYKF